jgi:hypothetical protein
MIILIIILAVLFVWTLEHLFKRDCGRSGCNGWEYTHTGICSRCCQPVLGTSAAIRFWRKWCVCDRRSRPKP